MADELRRCPEWGLKLPADDLLDWRVGDRQTEVCFDCHVRLTGQSLDELAERLHPLK